MLRPIYEELARLETVMNGLDYIPLFRYNVLKQRKYDLLYHIAFVEQELLTNLLEDK